MLKKLLLGAAAGALLMPVGLAISNTGGKGLARGGTTQTCAYYAKQKVAHAAGGSTRRCVVVIRTTITRTKTVYVPVTVTKTNNHSTTTTESYTTTETGTTPVTDYTTTTETFTETPEPTTITVDETGTQTEVVPSTTTTRTKHEVHFIVEHVHHFVDVTTTVTVTPGA
jgi:hypothetical protein